MQLFGAVNTSLPGTNGYSVIPEAGYLYTRLGAESVAPIGDNLVIATDYVISEIGGSSNEIYTVDTEGVETRLEPVFVLTLPAPLDADKVYISTLRGFGGALYFSPTHLNKTIKYKLACYAALISADMINLLLMPGKIEFSIFPVADTRYSTLCNGKTIKREGYPLYTQRVLATPGLASILVRPGDPAELIRVPDYKDVMPLLYTGTSDITGIIPGGTHNKSTLPRAGFIIPHEHPYTKTKTNNGKKNDAAGVTGPSPNEGDEGGKTGPAELQGAAADAFNSVVAKTPSKIAVHDWFNGPPYCPLYPYIIIR